MNKIKIIELLNRIANNEKVPRKIVFEDQVYIYEETEGYKTLVCGFSKWLGDCYEDWDKYNFLNLEVIILEEEE